MVKIIAIANQKGGVGKTTTTAALAALLAQAGRVLAVDLDQQASLTVAVGVLPSPAWTEAIRARIRAPRLLPLLPIQPTAHGFDVLAGDLELGAVEAFELTQPQRREYILADLLASIAGRYDWILLDCPPALGLLTVNALTAAHGVIIPCAPEYLAVQGVARLLASVADVRASLNKQLAVLGIVPTMLQYHGRQLPDHHKAILAELDQAGVPVLPSVPRRIAAQDAAGQGLPLPCYDPTNAAAVAYQAVATACWPEVFTHAQPA